MGLERGECELLAALDGRFLVVHPDQELECLLLEPIHISLNFFINDRNLWQGLDGPFIPTLQQHPLETRPTLLLWEQLLQLSRDPGQ